MALDKGADHISTSPESILHQIINIKVQGSSADASPLSTPFASEAEARDVWG